MRVKELVKLDQQGWISSAVQLSDYDDSDKNLELVKTYIFTTSAPDTYGNQTRSIASMDLLKDIKNSFLSLGSNRYHVMANYGHGKSHLGLVIANYFSKPYNSDENKAILSRISQAINNQALEEDYYEFKKQHDQFLVIRLRGDTPRSLREQFFPGLKMALEEHESTKDMELPFWNQAAITWLESKKDNKIVSSFLEREFNTDIPLLIRDVEENKHDAFIQYVEVFKHLNNGVSPSAEGLFSLREAAIWAIDTLCGDGKPLSGMLIIFDEFSQFILHYCQSKAIGDLQELLDGIGERKGKAVFIAFAPVDPNEVAEQTQSGQTLQNIKKELNRIDTNKKYVLHSLLESVLASYLAQSSSQWKKLLDEENNIKGKIYGETTENVWEYFLERYDHRFRWTHEKFREVVAEGCFPLHPFTTALLCSLDMRQGEGEARTILGFVRDQIEIIGDAPIVIDGKVNWIYPTTLVDYFQERLISSPQIFDAYENACKTLETTFSDRPIDIHRSILKALLLQEAGKLRADGNKQVTLISQLTGLEWGQTMDILKELAKSNVIQFDSTLKVNSFWPVSANPKALDQKIRELLEAKSFDSDTLFLLNKRMKEFILGSDQLSVRVSWGHSDDWAAISQIITAQSFTEENIKEIFAEYELTYQGIRDGNRGLVFWLLAQNEEEVNSFRENARAIIDHVFHSDFPPPVVLILPNSQNKDLVDSFLKFLCLEDIGKDQDVINEVGQTIYKSELDKTRKSVIRAIGYLFGDLENYLGIPRKHQDIIVPADYQPIINTLPIYTLQNTLEKLYELSYPYHPPSFFTEFRINKLQLCDSVKKVSCNLIFNRISNSFVGMGPVAQRICRDFLVSNWKLLSPTYWIQEPETNNLTKSWGYLNESIKSDEYEVQLSNIIPELLNHPYGFDYHTVTLLICSWIGKHKNELRFFSNGKVVSPEFLETELLKKGSLQDILGDLCNKYFFSISRRDVGRILNEGRKLITNIQKGESRSQERAIKEIALLDDLLNNNEFSPDEKIEFENARNTLNSGLECAVQYDNEIESILNRIEGEEDIRKLLNQCEKIKGLEFNSFILPVQPSLDEIQKRINLQIKEALEVKSNNIENMDSEESVILERNKLREIKVLLDQEGYLDLKNRINILIEKSTNRIAQLDQVRREGSIINEINAMSPQTNLSKLYEYRKRLEEISTGSNSLIQERDKKLNKINNEIKTLETFSHEVGAIVIQIKINDVKNLLERIIQNSNRYVDTPLENNLSSAKLYIYKLQDYLKEIALLQSISKDSAEKIKAINTQIKEIQNKYKHTLSEFHLNILGQVEKEIIGYQERKISEIKEWLENIEKNIGKIKLEEFEKQSSMKLPFMPSSLYPKMEAIQSKLSDKESQDIMSQIIKLFQSISDKKKQQECIERLNKVAKS